MNDEWPLPRIDEIFSYLREAHMFNKLDLRDAYNQIPIDLLHRHKIVIFCCYIAF